MSRPIVEPLVDPNRGKCKQKPYPKRSERPPSDHQTVLTIRAYTLALEILEKGGSKK